MTYCRNVNSAVSHLKPCASCGRMTLAPCVSALQVKECPVIALNPRGPKGELTCRILFDGEVHYVPLDLAALRAQFAAHLRLASSR